MFACKRMCIDQATDAVGTLSKQHMQKSITSLRVASTIQIEAEVKRILCIRIKRVLDQEVVRKRGFTLRA